MRLTPRVAPAAMAHCDRDASKASHPGHSSACWLHVETEPDSSCCCLAVGDPMLVLSDSCSVADRERFFDFARTPFMTTPAGRYIMLPAWPLRESRLLRAGVQKCATVPRSMYP